MGQSLAPSRHSVPERRHGCGEIGSVEVGVNLVFIVSDSMHMRSYESLNT